MSEPGGNPKNESNEAPQAGNSDYLKHIKMRLVDQEKCNHSNNYTVDSRFNNNTRVSFKQ